MFSSRLLDVNGSVVTVEKVLCFYAGPQKQHLYLCRRLVKLTKLQFKNHFSALDKLSASVLTTIGLLIDKEHLMMYGSASKSTSFISNHSVMLFKQMHTRLLYMLYIENRFVGR